MLSDKLPDENNQCQSEIVHQYEALFAEQEAREEKEAKRKLARKSFKKDRNSHETKKTCPIYIRSKDNTDY